MNPDILSNALHLSRGGKLVSLEHEKDERLLEVFDGISHYAGQFYYGRYDIKCASIEERSKGKNSRSWNITAAGPKSIIFTAMAIRCSWPMGSSASLEDARTDIRYNDKLGVPIGVSGAAGNFYAGQSADPHAPGVGQGQPNYENGTTFASPTRYISDHPRGT